MKTRALAVAAAALLLPLGAVACSDDSTGDLDKSDVKEVIMKGGQLTEEQADCVADAIIDADFTKEELDNMGSQDVDKVDSKKMKEYTDAFMKCATG